jgi:nicotinate-nucleotide pyrophosphorylase (carboxylating)
MSLLPRIFTSSAAAVPACCGAMELLREELILQHVRAALAEDVGSGDVTTLATIPENSTCTARMVAREPMCVAGLALAAAAFCELSSTVNLQLTARDGERVAKGAVLLTVTGSTARSSLPSVWR